MPDDFGTLECDLDIGNFTWEKKNGSFWAILNLKYLYHYVKQIFSNWNFRIMLISLQERMWGWKDVIYDDLRDFFFQGSSQYCASKVFKIWTVEEI